MRKIACAGGLEGVREFTLCIFLADMCRVILA